MFYIRISVLAKLGGRPPPLNPLIVRGSTREVCVSGGGGGAKGGTSSEQVILMV